MTITALFAAALAANIVVAVVAFFRPDAPDEFDQVPADVAAVIAEAEVLCAADAVVRAAAVS
jgi:hypothetical protein